MLNIVLCDDDEVILKKYQETVLAVSKQLKLTVFIKIFTSAKQLLEYLNTNQIAIDLFFLDIEMEEMNGIELSRKIRQFNQHSAIVFLTSSKEYVFESFDVLPIDYILKGEAAENKITKVLTSCQNKLIKDHHHKLVFKRNAGFISLDKEDIVYFEYLNRQVNICCLQHEYQINYRLQDIYDEVKDLDFMQIHKSFIVNLKYVKMIKNNEIVLVNQDTLPIGRKYLNSAKKHLTEYLMYSSATIGIDL